LDLHGFMCVTPPPPVDFMDRRLVKEEYYPKLAEMVRRITGAKAGFAYQYLNRDGSIRTFPYAKDDAFGSLFSRFCHSDYGPGSPAMMRRKLVEDFDVPEEEAGSCDLLIANVWLPRDRPAYTDPLCLLDASSMRWPEELVELPFSTAFICAGGPPENVKGVLEQSSGGTSSTSYVSKASGKTGSDAASTFEFTGPRYSSLHRGVFCPDMRPDEAWLFKQYDTREGVARQCFHNSFRDPFHEKDSDLPGRRSVEFRILLTFPKQPASSKL